MFSEAPNSSAKGIPRGKNVLSANGNEILNMCILIGTQPQAAIWVYACDSSVRKKQ